MAHGDCAVKKRARETNSMEMMEVIMIMMMETPGVSTSPGHFSPRPAAVSFVSRFLMNLERGFFNVNDMR